MAGKQIIVTTVFGPKAEDLAETFGTFAKVPASELHAFVYNAALPHNRCPGVQYHLANPDEAFVSIRRDALFRRWTLPDQLGAEFALVVDCVDAICVRPLPPFANLLRGASVAASTEWIGAVAIPGQGYTGAYLNAGVTFWNLPQSRELRQEIAGRGRRFYRGPFDDQTALNEVVYTRYYDQLTILPPQYNWRASFQKDMLVDFRKWPRVDSLDGVMIYHNHKCIREVAAALRLQPPGDRAVLPELPQDQHPLSSKQLLWRRLVHRWRHT